MFDNLVVVDADGDLGFVTEVEAGAVLLLEIDGILEPSLVALTSRLGAVEIFAFTAPAVVDTEDDGVVVFGVVGLPKDEAEVEVVLGVVGFPTLLLAELVDEIFVVVEEVTDVALGVVGLLMLLLVDLGVAVEVLLVVALDILLGVGPGADSLTALELTFDLPDGVGIIDVLAVFAPIEERGVVVVLEVLVRTVAGATPLVLEKLPDLDFVALLTEETEDFCGVTIILPKLDLFDVFEAGGHGLLNLEPVVEEERTLLKLFRDEAVPVEVTEASSLTF